jgi:hypothetical protein
MNLEHLRGRLVAAARQEGPDDGVPYGFSKRVISRLRSCSPLDAWGFWAQALWRATAPCVAVAVLIGAWCLFSALAAPPTTGNGGFDVAQEFENTLLAGADFDSPDSTR